MGSTGGHQPSAAKKADDKLTIDNLWKILASEKDINEAVGRMQQLQKEGSSLRSKSRNGLYEPQDPSKVENVIGTALR